MNRVHTVSSAQYEPTTNVHEELPAPQGIGAAVAFDWGLVVQILLTPFVPLVFKGAGTLKLGSNPLLSALLSFLLVLPVAALLAIFGEGVRRGWRWTRLIQLVANTLLFLYGLVGLWSLWQRMQVGDYWGLVTSVILVIVSPIIAWRLSRPGTRSWFERVSSAQARLRHGGSWPCFISCFAIVGGVLQTLAVVFK